MLGHAADRFGLHPNLPICGVKEFHESLLNDQSDLAGIAAFEDLIQVFAEALFELGRRGWAAVGE
jgi:hypothetical protein